MGRYDRRSPSLNIFCLINNNNVKVSVIAFNFIVGIGRLIDILSLIGFNLFYL